MQLERAAMNARPIANLGVAILHIAGNKNPQAEWFDPYSAKLYDQQAKAIINPEAARIFLDLASNGKLSSWVGSRVDIKLIQSAAKQ